MAQFWHLENGLKTSLTQPPHPRPRWNEVRDKMRVTLSEGSQLTGECHINICL